MPELVEIEGVDHFPFAGDAEELIGEIEQFLDRRTRTSPTPERQLLTVLFTDIVDSTEQGAELGDRRWRELLESHDEVVREQLDRYRGREIKTTGDGFLATFDGPGARRSNAPARSRPRCGRWGSRCAPACTPASARSAATTSPASRSTSGRGSAPSPAPGEVLVSGTVKDLVVGSEIEFEARGSHALKGVPGEWTVFAAGA